MNLGLPDHGRTLRLSRILNLHMAYETQGNLKRYFSKKKIAPYMPLNWVHISTPCGHRVDVITGGPTKAIDDRDRDRERERERESSNFVQSERFDDGIMIYNIGDK